MNVFKLHVKRSHVSSWPVSSFNVLYNLEQFPSDFLITQAKVAQSYQSGATQRAHANNQVLEEITWRQACENEYNQVTIAWFWFYSIK